MPAYTPRLWCALVVCCAGFLTACAANDSEAIRALETSTTHTTSAPAPTSFAPTTTTTHATTTTIPATTSTQPTTTTTVDEPTATVPITTTTLPPPTIAISPRGIPVRVSELTDQGWAVHDPCGDLVPITKAFPVRNVQVVLDPGHGGKDPGTRGPTGLKESELNLKVSLAVSQLLQDRNIGTLLTRTGDYYIELNERIALADAANAAALISIHHNAPAAAKSNTPGTEVFAQTGDQESARLAGLLHQEVFEALSTVEQIQWTSRWDAGALRVVNSSGGDAYSLVRKPETTNALLEVAYLASPSEGEFLATDQYIKLIAPPIADAIETFLTTDEIGTPLLERARIHNPSGGRRTCPLVDLE